MTPPVAPAVPLIGPRNDFAVIAPVLAELAVEFGIPYDVLLAQAYQESSWLTSATRYEPAFDARYVSSAAARLRWAHDPCWISQGMTAAAWFAAHPSRRDEMHPGVDWSFVAQFDLASSHGALQVMLTTARGLGFQGTAPALAAPTGLRWGVLLLSRHYAAGLNRGLKPLDALTVALARYNGGASGNDRPGHLRTQNYVAAVGRRYRDLWGKDMAV